MGLFLENQWSDSSEYSGGENEATSYRESWAPEQVEPVYTQSMIDAARVEGTAFTASETALEGNANSPAVVSTRMQQSGSSGSVFSGLNNLLGSVASTARDLGSAVGSVKGAVRDAKGQYKTAEKNAATNNKLGQWWQYSSTQDKLMVAIGVVGLVFLVAK